MQFFLYNICLLASFTLNFEEKVQRRRHV